uniref:Uncharacterized mitochondrial protein AtMg00810-like n=1 Tax=Nicotiana tabacum TaxID=4097 RepID=A0A1S3ZFE2_TOBAC|nr:PREDICTED: uncharacterized mitochondrial protein AtMg00810-like [Nicotiana tabacum]
MVLVLIYVDDMLITRSSLKLIQYTKTSLQNIFKMKDLGELRYFLGLELARSNKGIIMHQRKYTLELIAKVGLTAVKPSTAPMVSMLNLQQNSMMSTSQKMKDQLKILIPDITYGVQTLSQFLQQPKKSHMEAALRIVKYVKNNPGQGILLSSQYNTTITAYCDADWAACPVTRRSSAEAKYRSLAATVAELTWLVGMLKEIDAEVKLPVDIFTDSKAAIQIVDNPVYHERTKHIKIDCHFIREKIQ